MIKLVALDMDGTLLNSDKQISTTNKQAIKQARDMGVTVMLASGRPPEGMQKQLVELGLTTEQDFVLSYNGAWVQNVGTQQVICQQALTGQQTKAIATFAKQCGAHVHAFSDQLGLITPEHNTYTTHEANINGIEVNLFDFAQLDDDACIIKAMIIDEPEIIDEVTKKLPASIKDNFTIVRSAPFFLEILNIHSNKGAGVKAVADHLGLSADNVMCMGDAENDHHMLKYAGVAVAMGNATEETKALCDYVSSTNDEHGVAKAMEKYIFN